MIVVAGEKKYPHLYCNYILTIFTTKIGSVVLSKMKHVMPTRLPFDAVFDI